VTVVVIGGGVVGLCVAEALQHRGAQVTLLERGRCGAGASHGNAGWITPSHALPLPAPGVVLQALRWLPDPAGPLRLRPSAAMVPWAWRFWRHSRPASFAHGAQALQGLVAGAVDDVRALHARIAPFELRTAPLMYVLGSEQERHHVEAEVDVLRAAGHGGRIEVLDAAAARRHEPALGTTGASAGAVLMHGEAQVRPETLCAALHTTLLARGVDVREDEEVRALRRVRDGWEVDTASATVAASAVVVAAGADAAAVTRLAGLRLALQPAKGYSVTFARTPDAPRSAIYLHAAKVAISPYEAGVRVSGMLELGARRPEPSPARIERFVQRAAAALPGWRPQDPAEPWAGARPLLPDGLPALGPVPERPGLFLAAGHGTLGVTLGPTTGRVLAGAVLAGEPVPAPLASGRLRLA
jgi:D-amino-acid dehydrogenase